jgi:hypothetical protein
VPSCLCRQSDWPNPRATHLKLVLEPFELVFRRLNLMLVEHGHGYGFQEFVPQAAKV